jgi:16S rRNA (adenine1518-N6/adenine1519-N6)-dimethyltransferase
MFKIIKAGFNQRRKTLANSLLPVETNMAKSKLLQILDKAEIDSLRRGETLSLHEYARLANTWQEQVNHGSAG